MNTTISILITSYVIMTTFCIFWLIVYPNIVRKTLLLQYTDTLSDKVVAVFTWVFYIVAVVGTVSLLIGTVL